MLPAATSAAPSPSSARPPVAIPFRLDAGRILLQATFLIPGGGRRQALAWFNMGMMAPILTKPLYQELLMGAGAPLRIEADALILEAPAQSVTDDGESRPFIAFPQYFGPHKVEAMLPASMFLAHRVTLDYKHHRLVIDADAGKTPAGVAVPLNVNRLTGLASIEAEVGGRGYAFVIDAGSGYSWMRGDVLESWLIEHPAWRKARGAIGAANYNMLDLPFDLDFEKGGVVARLPTLSLGGLDAKDVALLGAGHAGVLGGFASDLFWDNWQKSAPTPVAGWLGPNVLARYELTLDYPKSMSYWRAIAAANAHDLDSAGVTLLRRGDRYFISGLVDAPGQPQAEGVGIGDELIAIDGLDARGASRGDLLAALRGKPGERRRLKLLRKDATRDVDAPILDLR